MATLQKKILFNRKILQSDLHSMNKRRTAFFFYKIKNSQVQKSNF